MKYLIDLPDAIKDSAGVEYEPTGERRCPQKGEAYLSQNGVGHSSFNFVSEKYIILRRKLTPIEEVRAAYDKVAYLYGGKEMLALGEAIAALEAQCSSS